MENKYSSLEHNKCDLLLKENIELKEFNKQLINDKKNLMERLHSSVNVKTITIAFNDLEDEIKRLKNLCVQENK
jgi:hypothetical protein